MSTTHGFKRMTAALGLAVGLVATAFADDPGFPAPVGDPAFVPAGAKLERIFDGGCMLTEGVAAGHDGMIYFSDITFTKFCKDPSGKYRAGWQYLEVQPADRSDRPSSAARAGCPTASSSIATAT